MSTSMERSMLLAGMVMGRRPPLDSQTNLYNRRLIGDSLTDFGQINMHDQIEAAAESILVPGWFVANRDKRIRADNPG